MGHGDDRARVVLEVLLQPRHGLGIEVVRGLVQQENVRLLEQAAGTGPPGAARRRRARRYVVSGSGQRRASMACSSCVSRSQQSWASIFSCSSPCRASSASMSASGSANCSAIALYSRSQRHLLGGPFLHHLADGLGLVELRFLVQHARGVALAQHGLAVEVVVHARHDAQHRALARTVEAQYADLGAIEVAEGDVLDDGLVVVDLADPHHRIDDLGLIAGGLGHGGIPTKRPCGARPFQDTRVRDLSERRRRLGRRQGGDGHAVGRAAHVVQADLVEEDDAARDRRRARRRRPA